ncbi:hypothetical protein Q4491_17235 [Photobacterium sp. 2_MG-2023]|uniref:Asparaginyl-tRNA synthetase n=1 Tax=Photobacterium arenosum TaxID=2774143 RepID=A0ABR9BFQ7_9GAMM|nr:MULTISPECIES: hypothetical protein [Photobacterium]MBD8511390.1 hypothetical protein [Photobacterium arenosum]MBV7263047.1 hypothetical protein [Photobacterium sp. WH24]MDO6583089.1 hypothetical protein [Photobacterium sp. 2_MG-2023]
MERTTKVKDEVKFIYIAIICVFLVVLGHFILMKNVAYFAWAEATAAAIPFLLIGLGVAAVRRAVNIDKKNTPAE